MTPTQMVILMIVAFVLLILLGHPLAFILGGLAVIFGAIFWGNLDVLNMFCRTTSNLMTSIAYVCTPLFIFMGAVLQRSGAAEGARENPVASEFVDGNGLAGDRGLIDGR